MAPLPRSVALGATRQQAATIRRRPKRSGATGGARPATVLRAEPEANVQKERLVSKDIIRVEPISSLTEARKVPISPVVRSGDLVFVSNIPPYDRIHPVGAALRGT